MFIPKIDYENKKVDNFVLWSGDSDFADPIVQLLKDNKKVMLFATVRKVSTELRMTSVPIFDIQKIKELICWKRELPENVARMLISQKDSQRSP